MKFAVLSDTHYLSEDIIHSDPNGEWSLKRKINVNVMKSLSKRTDIDTILITGDLVDNGDEKSHLEFAELLRQLKSTGKNVYVLTATHDFHFSTSKVIQRGWQVKYKNAPWNSPWSNTDDIDYKSLVKDEFSHLSPEECVPPLRRVCSADELWDLYGEFGREQAFSVYERGYSYCVKLSEKLWCLMLNNNFRDFDGLGDVSPSYSPECLCWMEKIVKQAKDEGAFVFACTHHPLIPPVPAYKIGGGAKNMRNAWVCHTLADIGISLVFSGHTHFSNIVFGSSERGNVICNVTTPSICFYPSGYRTAEIDEENHVLRTECVEIPKTDDYGIKESTLKEHYFNCFANEQRDKISRLPKPINEITLNMKVKHLYPLCKRTVKLTAAEYDRIKDKLIFDIVIELAANMQSGDGAYSPDTPIYKFMMGLSAAADSIISAQPFVPVEKKLLGYSISEIVEPMLYKNGVPDNNAEFVFDKLPETESHNAIISYSGEILMAVLSVFAFLISPLSPAVTAAIIPVMTLLKRKKTEKHPYRPERY